MTAKEILKNMEALHAYVTPERPDGGSGETTEFGEDS